MIGSTVIPGAVILVNNDLSPLIKQTLITQLHITEAITGDDFDARLAADPNLVATIRGTLQRYMVIRNFQDTNNRNIMDVIIFVKAGLAYIERNCFGPTGQTYPIKNLYWGQLHIYNTKLDRVACKTPYCSECQDNGYGRSDGYDCLDANRCCDNQTCPCNNGVFNYHWPVQGLLRPHVTCYTCKTFNCTNFGCNPAVDNVLVKNRFS